MKTTNLGFPNVHGLKTRGMEAYDQLRNRVAGAKDLRRQYAGKQ